jgi:phosphoenolpyruvate carboxykinase (ATP)
MYHYISGYTAKVAGTEVGVNEPEATFSACFGAPFLVWHPMKYASLLAEKMRKHNAKVWLVNTGWSGGPYGVGKRMSIAHTRAIIDAIHAGALDNVETTDDPVFGLHIPRSVPGVPENVLIPSKTWADKNAYQATTAKLSRLFNENFKKYADEASDEVKKASPMRL